MFLLILEILFGLYLSALVIAFIISRFDKKGSAMPLGGFLLALLLSPFFFVYYKIKK